ncbi:head GIN domain-containing protein [uncultured Polaribacter sp.]|uniref:head GIN domain-containing protein n=1 Tax=uncultured Polaribacter sp. TaxID=174711 RepID=UPI0026303902|nr:head GIN domain-containing protein [uncultured Polaribacter sp.]
MYKKISLSILIIVFTFSTNAQNWWGNSKKIKGNGNIVTVKRTTSDYDDVSIGGSFDVKLIKGKEGKITIKGEENIIPYIETEVKGNTLYVKFEKNINVRTTKGLTVTITYTDIDKIALGGSGNLTSNGVIKSKNFKVSLGGSGNITLQVDSDEITSSIGGSGNIILSGNTNEFTCSIAGSGSIKAYDLTTDEISANIAGSGSIKTTVNTKIKAKVVGSGSIYYKGNPKYVDSKSVGSGDVIDKN